MNNSMEMKFSLFCLFMLVLVYHGLGLECPNSSCGKHGLHIRFPFRLKDRQPKDCGYPGFDLSCAGDHAVLELPNSVILHIQNIDYVGQVITVSDPDNCLPRQAKHFHLSDSIFKFGITQWDYESRLEDYTFFKCSLAADRDDLDYSKVPCLSSHDYEVYAVDSDRLISDLPLTFCTKMYNISSVSNEMMFYNSLHLNWSEPRCGDCEKMKKGCSLKDNGTQVKCDMYPAPGPHTWFSNASIAGIVLGLFLLVLLLLALYHVYSSDRKKKEHQAKIERFLEDYKALKPTRYSYADLKRITNEFKDKLGQGAYGTVFKGKLSNEIFVAVKILNNSTGNGEEFINEVGTMGRIHHVNVVRLVGFCADGFRRALVYEFLPNESLEKFIFSNDGKNHSLGWEKLQDIAFGVAKGIEYLHQGCDQRILHFDIKPHNILLDNNFTPKISDFGLAKLCSKDQSAVSMTAARGTMGYIAPEVFSRNFGNVSYKSDIYSFGMLLLEMVGGRKNIDVNVENMSQIYFPEWAYNHLDQGDELRIRIEEEGDNKIVKKLTIVGLWCIQWYPVDRPSMKIVVQMLEGEGDNLTIPPNPFASTGPKKTDARLPGRRLHQELEVISEVD